MEKEKSYYQVSIGTADGNRIVLKLDYNDYQAICLDTFIQLGCFVFVYKTCKNGEIQNPE